MASLRVAILGPGAIGGFLAAILERGGAATTCVASGHTADAIASHGLQLESSRFGDFTVHPRCVTHLDEKPAALFVTTKATSLRQALDRVPSEVVVGIPVIPLLNGIDHVRLLRQMYGEVVVPAAISIVARRRQNTIFHLSKHARLSFAKAPPLVADLLKQLCVVLVKCGVDVDQGRAETKMLWDKLVRLNAMACTTAATGFTLGQLLKHPEWCRTLEACVSEGTAVANAEGVSMSVDDVMATIRALPESLQTSMQHDVELGQSPELDAIPGAIIRAGTLHGLACPTIESLMTAIQRRVSANSETSI